MFRRNLSLESDTDRERAMDGAYKSCVLEVPRPGNYRVAVTIRAEDSAPLGGVMISAGRAGAIFQGEIPGETLERTVVVNMGDWISRELGRVCEDRSLTVAVAAGKAFVGRISVREISCPTVYIAETAEACAAPEGMQGEDVFQSGLGRILSACAGDRFSVSDHFQPGLTPEAFRREGHYAAISQYSRPGDLHFFRFGCMEEDMEEREAGERYRRQIVRYILEARERLVYPVLFVPSFGPGGAKRAALCARICREAGQVTGVPVIEPEDMPQGGRDARSMAQEIVKACSKYPGSGYRFLARCLADGFGLNANETQKKIS